MRYHLSGSTLGQHHSEQETLMRMDFDLLTIIFSSSVTACFPRSSPLINQCASCVVESVERCFISGSVPGRTLTFVFSALPSVLCLCQCNMRFRFLNNAPAWARTFGHAFSTGRTLSLAANIVIDVGY